MTARRDLAELERQGVARRTHGGAVLPGPSSHEDAFAQRIEVAVEAKERLAAAAVALIAPGEAVFVDSSSTSFYAARRLVRDNVRCTLVTNSVPVMDIVCAAGAPQVELIGLGGALRTLTRSFVGPKAVHGVRVALRRQGAALGEGRTEGGQLTDPDALEAEVKRAMIGHARTPLLLVDGSKFERPALNAIVPITDIGRVIAADAPPPALFALRRLGVAVDRV